MSSTKDNPDERRDTAEESAAIEQEHEVDAAEDTKPVEEVESEGEEQETEEESEEHESEEIEDREAEQGDAKTDKEKRAGRSTDDSRKR